MAKKTKESDVILNFRMNGEVAYSKSIKQINDDMRVATLEYKNQVSSIVVQSIRNLSLKH